MLEATKQASPSLTAQQLSPYEKAYKLISTHKAGALATADKNGKPHVAIVYCIAKEDLGLYFSTRIESRKFKNIQANQIVSLAFFDELNMETVQITGQVERVGRLSVEQEVLRELIQLRYGEPNWPVPPIKMFEKKITNELAILKVIPTELTYGSFGTAKDGRYQPFFEEVI